MKAVLAALLGLWIGVGAALAQPLTLEEALAQADAPHPDLDAARAQQELAEAERQFADSLNDLRVTLDAALRSGHNPINGLSPDHQVRLNARKTLWDAGRQAAGRDAARLEGEARTLQLQEVRAQRRQALMLRFFDVLLADQQYAADTEYTAVAYVGWDNNKDRFELGQLSAPQMAELEALYQERRMRRGDSERKLRERRALLANAMNRPGDLPAELAEPALTGNDRPLPEFEALLAAMREHNPRIRMQARLLDASRSQLTALRADNLPSLEFEAEAAAYSRETATRDDLRAGLNLVWPLYSGRRLDARIAREQAQFHALQAQHERLLLDLRQGLYETWQEVQYLRDSERKAAAVNAGWRDLALERARAEYELELKTTLGNSMADTQTARLRRLATEYRLALAWERLDALLGVPVGTVKTEEKK